MMICESLKNKGLAIWCGNGGSASDSMHLSTELLGRFKNNRKALCSISLATDSTSITCISNDFGYENLFSRQIEGLANKNDILISITTSGNSVNIINAIKKAKSLNLKTILMSGNSGGKCAGLADLEIIVPSTSTARIIKKYLDGLKFCKNIVPAFPYKLKNSSYWMFTLRCKSRDELIKFLKSRGISTTVYIKPLPLHPLYKEYNHAIKNSLKVWQELVTVPTFPELTDNQLHFVIKSLKEFDKRIENHENL